MCGIVGFLGKKNGRNYLLAGLQNLEYRGYDSAGIGFVTDDPAHPIERIKVKGKLKVLAEKYLPATENISIHTGIGHTRWATHGEPSEVNAHPIISFSKRFIIVHNGIVENYFNLKEQLLHAGIHFTSMTDTEVLINYIDYTLQKEFAYEQDIFLAIAKIIARDITGSFATLILDVKSPDKIICVRRKSPMALGRSAEGDFYLASDANAFTKEVNEYAVISDNTCLELQLGGTYCAVDFRNLQTITLTFESFTGTQDAQNKGEHEHYMLKEIKEQADILKTLYAEYTDEKSTPNMGLKEETLAHLKTARTVYLIGCGTSFHAGKFGEYIFESLGLDVYSESAGEFKYRDTPVRTDAVYIFLSQSGETADIITTAEKIREHGGFVLGITNVINSSICFVVDDVLFMKAGPEISVASTKAFSAQLVILIFLARTMGKLRGTTLPNDTLLFSQLAHIDTYLETNVFSRIAEIKKIASDWIVPARVVLFIGRNVNYPVALEGALKLKEISYINCQGMPMGELKHGTLALVDEKSITIAIESRPDYYGKFISNVREILARKGKVVVIKSNVMQSIGEEGVIEINYPHEHYIINTIVNAVFLQLIAYYTALHFDVDIDKPRNLAKSVTVE